MFSFHRLAIWTIVLFVVIGITHAHAGHLVSHDGNCITVMWGF